MGRGVAAPVEERFNRFVIQEPMSGCWLWTCATQSHKYGVIRFEGKNIRAHRMSWVLNKGVIPKGQKVLHRCDVPECVNPKHLFLGTQQDNIKDCIDKGRRLTPEGQSHCNAKLTEEQVIAIRNDSRQQKLIAAEYGVSRFTIGDIQHRRNWKHVSGGN